MFAVMRYVIFALPLLVFLGWFAYRAQQKERITREQYLRYRRILFILGGANILLMVALWIATLMFEQPTERMEYIPAKNVGGKLIPGHLEPSDERY